MEKRLYRSKKDRVLFGVCGGIGEYLDVDSTLIRIVLVLLIFAWGTGILVYIICAIIIPENPYQHKEESIEKESIDTNAIETEITGHAIGAYSDRLKTKKRNEEAIGLILIVLGALFLLHNFVPWFNFGKLWPLILIAIGLIILFRNISLSGER